MLITKNIDTDVLYSELEEAVRVALLEHSHEELRAQKYFDEEQGELWGVSFDKSRGMKVATKMENELIFMLFEKIIEEPEDMFYELETHLEMEAIEDKKTDELITIIAEMIEEKWDEKDTINIETECYNDEYDMNGVSRSDFLAVG